MYRILYTLHPIWLLHALPSYYVLCFEIPSLKICSRSRHKTCVTRPYEPRRRQPRPTKIRLASTSVWTYSVRLNHQPIVTKTRTVCSSRSMAITTPRISIRRSIITAAPKESRRRRRWWRRRVWGATCWWWCASHLLRALTANLCTHLILMPNPLFWSRLDQAITHPLIVLVNTN